MGIVAISTSRRFRNSMGVHETRTEREHQTGWRVFTLLLSLAFVGTPQASAQLYKYGIHLTPGLAEVSSTLRS